MRLDAQILLATNQLVPPRARRHATEQAHFEHTYTVAQERAAAFARHVDFSGKRLLDIGCGFGAKGIFYAKETPVSEVVGLDLNPRRIEQAKRYAAKSNVEPSRIHFETGDGSRLPFDDDSFDLILSEDMIEHVVDVPGFLAECRRILRTGGAVLMRGGPFYFSPWGAHLYYQFGMPWVSLLFSRNAIADASSTLPQPEGVFLTSTLAEEIEQFDELNRLTPRRLTQLVDASGLGRAHWEWGPRRLRPLGCLPWLGPLFTASLTAVLVERRPLQN
jgi:ubiquinone/menaquinone biosynthesis C-methylase UbiE